MKKLLVNLLISCIMYPLSISAQNQDFVLPCGTHTHDLRFLVNNMDSLRTKYKDLLEVRGAIAYVPVTFHLVGMNDGSRRQYESKILDLLDEVNRIYTANGIELQFYLRRFNYINSETLFTTPRTLAAVNISFGQKKTDSMNIFITENGGSSTNDVVLGYYSSRSSSFAQPYDTDWIVVIRSEATNARAGTLAHEIGHFFSLPHTFNGWEPSPFSPTQSSPCSPRFASDGATLSELASREADGNCRTAGDRFCDTPADYNFGFTQGSDWNNPQNRCIYNGIAKDNSCVALDPDETNLMGYFINCQSKFSNEQRAAMLRDYGQNSFRSYLRAGNQTPYLGDMPATTLQLPADRSTVTASNVFNLDWADVPNATGYVLEFGQRLSFELDSRSFVTTTSNFTINASNVGADFLIPGRTYFWRVRAFSPYKTGVFSGIFRFTAGNTSSVKEIEGVSNFTVSPNPVGKERVLQFSMTNDNNFEGLVKIYNSNGQILKSEKRRFVVGQNINTLDVAELRSGFYIFAIESADRVVKQKFFVTD